MENRNPLSCTNCNHPLPGKLLNTSDLVNCPSCNTSLLVDVFPALFRTPTSGQSGEALSEQNEAGCFYHPNKKAVVLCEMCGRFLCALCDLELDGRHLCPSCIEKGKKNRKLKSLENHRLLYDNIALALAVYPLLMFWLTILTAPLAIFVAVRYWKSPSSILPRTKIRYILAIVLAIMQIAGWIWLMGFIIFKWVSR